MEQETKKTVILTLSVFAGIAVAALVIACLIL